MPLLFDDAKQTLIHTAASGRSAIEATQVLVLISISETLAEILLELKSARTESKMQTPIDMLLASLKNAAARDR